MGAQREPWRGIQWKLLMGRQFLSWSGNFELYLSLVGNNWRDMLITFIFYGCHHGCTGNRL